MWINSPIFLLWAVWKSYFVFYSMFCGLTARGKATELPFLEYLVSGLLTKTFFLHVSLLIRKCTAWPMEVILGLGAFLWFSVGPPSTGCSKAPSRLFPAALSAPLCSNQGRTRIVPFPESVCFSCQSVSGFWGLTRMICRSSLAYLSHIFFFSDHFLTFLTFGCLFPCLLMGLDCFLQEGSASFY